MMCRTRYHSLVFLCPTGANTSGGGSQECKLCIWASRIPHIVVQLSKWKLNMTPYVMLSDLNCVVSCMCSGVTRCITCYRMHCNNQMDTSEMGLGWYWIQSSITIFSIIWGVGAAEATHFDVQQGSNDTRMAEVTTLQVNWTYVAGIFRVKNERKWSDKRFERGYMSSVLIFGCDNIMITFLGYCSSQVKE